MMSTSLCSGPMGSSEISARPVLVTTVLTSGNFRISFSTKVPTLTEPWSDALGRRTTLMAMAPSSRGGGRNSVPMPGTRAMVATNRTTAMATLARRCREVTRMCRSGCVESGAKLANCGRKPLLL